MATGTLRKERTRRRMLEKEASARTMRIISQDYPSIRGELLTGTNASYSGRTEEDMLADTFEYVIREKLDHLTDGEVIVHFKRKFRTIKTQTIQDYKEKMKYYALYTQAEKGQEQEE